MNGSLVKNILSRYWLPLAIMAMVLTRLPLLWNGYGSDPDAWRVANVANALWTTGHYAISRPPGYPLHEIISAPFVAWGGSVLSNFTTIAATILFLIGVFQWARECANHPRLLTALLAFTPLVWLNSATTMDYMWSLLFIVLGLNDARGRQAARAGVWIGIAGGFRLSNLVVVIPFCIMLSMTHRSKRPLLLFLAATGATVLVAFTPVLFHYGLLGWLNEMRAQTAIMHLALSDRVLSFGYRSLYAIGPLAVLAASWIVAANRNVVVRLLRERNVNAIIEVVAMVVFAALFFLLPLDRSYLLPAVFFFLLFIDRIATEKQFVAFMVCAISFAFIKVDIIRHKGSERGEIGIHAAPGIIVEEIQKREKLLRDRFAIANAAIDGDAMIMTGTSESFWFENSFLEPDTSHVWRTFSDPIVRNRSNHRILFTPALNKAELRLVRKQGYSVYCIEGMKDYLESFVGYSMKDAGVPLIQP